MEVTFTSDSQFFVGLAGDLSEGGVFVSTYQPLPIGARVAIEFTLPSGVVKAKGTVRWTRSASDGATPGIGISFDAIPDETRAKIAAFCEHRAPLYYEVDDGP